MTEGITNISNQSFGQSGSANSSSGTVGKDEFLKLLTYQLRAQNPMKPYDNQEFAAQLAQFSQLEQLTDIRSLLEEQVQTNLVLTQTISNTALPGLLGKNAKALTDKFQYSGTDGASLGYMLNYPAQSGLISIYNEAGALINTIPIDADGLKQGDHSFEWDGTDFNGKNVGAGKFSFKVEAKDQSGASTLGTTYMLGKIEAVRFKSEGTILVINGMEIPLQAISDVLT